MSSELIKWLSENLISYTDLGVGRFKTALGVCLEVKPNDQDKILDLKSKPSLILDSYAQSQLQEGIVEYFVFEFGAKFYYTSIHEVELKKLSVFRYFGEVEWGTPIEKVSRAHLMVHGKYELMCGLHSYEEWAKKAKFLGFSALGIAEKNTLAGAIQFTQACKKEGLKPIIGITTDFEYRGSIVTTKLYARTEIGWENIIELNSNTSTISFEEFRKYLQGTICIVSPSVAVDAFLLEDLNSIADQTYFQLTTVIFEYQMMEMERLKNIQWFIRNYSGSVKPILNNDTYCLEKEQERLKKILVKQSGKKVFLTKNHWFQSYDSIVQQFYNYFNKEDKTLFQSQVITGGQSMSTIINSVEFELKGDTLHLPAYQMKQAELSIWKDKEEMFKGLISRGVSEKIDINKYPIELIYERISREGRLIKEGGFIDYFLILWDIIRYCDENKIEVGPGRGSAAGSLISYLIGITKINPLDYDLLFERFLNESRIKQELPDIDIDFASDRRDEVLKYMRDVYGFDYVCQVGTYGTLKLKSALKELNRHFKILKPEEIGYLAKLFSDEEDSFFDIFRVISSSSNKRLVQFVRDHHAMLHDVESIIGSLKNSSIHACATIIVPKIEMKTVSRQIPIRVHEDGTLVSEWEGEELAKAGYLKEDILSTRQMSKIGNMINLVEKHTGKRIRTQDIPLDDEKVFDLFCQGYNQDVFHFGSSGLTTYLKHVQPRHIEDLIAAIALYRPGAMASDSHMEFVKLKNGEKDPEYDFMMEDVTRDTYGLYIYQEQIMKAVQVLGGFTLTEADGVRKAMGKKIKEKMDKYGEQFIQEAIKKGCDKEHAIHIWEKLQVFSAYGFNKSHAAAYSVVGYICNWFKANYPLEFWITTFENADKDDMPEYLSEISKISDIKVSAPNINKSTNHFEYDIDLRTLYWDITKIIHVGEKAVEAILIEREERGQFFSIDEFFYRMEEFDIEKHGFNINPINKRVVENLILAGAFDELHNIEQDFSRYNLIARYYETRKDNIPQVYTANATSKHFWPIQQYEVCRLSLMDYKSLVNSCEEFSSCIEEYLDGESFNQKGKSCKALIIGVLDSFEIRNTKRGDAFATLKILHNNNVLNVRIWPSELNSQDERLLFTYSYQDEVVKGTLENILPRVINKILVVRGNLELPDTYKSYNELVMSPHIEGKLIKFFD